MATELKLPQLGDNIDSGTVVTILVAEGERIEPDQGLIEIEMGKSVTEVPSTLTGIVKQILVKAGDTVNVGQPILNVETGDEEAPAPVTPATAAPAPAAAAAPTPPASATASNSAADKAGQVAAEVRASERQGGARPETASSTVDANQSHTTAPPPSTGTLPHGAASSPVPGPAPGENGVMPVSTAALVQDATPISHTPAAASPSVRRLARELGVDINQVTGTGAGGRISEADVKKHGKQALTGAAPDSAGIPLAGVAPTPALPDFARWGEIERQPLSNVRRATADQMTRSWLSVAHVTQFDKADITDLEVLRKRYAKPVEAKGGKLTVTAIILKVVTAALRRFPHFNASLDLHANELVLKKYCHVGVAVDTERGLIVPVVRDADTKNIVELAVELQQIANRARDRKTSLEEMQGGSFTITNLGGIGGTGFTPIVNAPEVAILGVARAGMEPVYSDGAFQPRLMLPLSLSYDHRVIDGADGARFLRWIASALEEPFLLALEG